MQNNGSKYKFNIISHIGDRLSMSYIIYRQGK